MTDFEDRLRAGLRAVADETEPPPTLYGTVTARLERAPTASRRRPVVLALAAAVVVALAAAGLVVALDDAEEDAVDVVVEPPVETSTTVAPTTTTTTIAPAPRGWRTIAPFPLGPREGAVVVWTGAEMVVWGGIRPSAEGPPEPAPDGAAYDPATDSWRGLPPAPIEARREAAVVWTGREVLVWGGSAARWTSPDDPNAHVQLSDGAAYDPASNSWRPLAAAPISPRQAAAVWTGREMVVWGGAQHQYEWTETLADGAAYDPATDTWRMLPASPLTERERHALVWTGAEVLVWGGSGSGYAEIPEHDDGAAWDPTTGAWRALADAAVAGEAVEAWLGDRLVVAVQASSRTVTYDPATDEWSERDRHPLDNRGGTAHADMGDRLAVWGGRSFDVPDGGAVDPYHADGFVYDPAKDEWSALPPAPIAPRAGASAVWTGEELIVWGGGVSAGGVLADGARYRP